MIFGAYREQEFTALVGIDEGKVFQLISAHSLHVFEQDLFLAFAADGVEAISA